MHTIHRKQTKAGASMLWSQSAVEVLVDCDRGFYPARGATPRYGSFQRPAALVPRGKSKLSEVPQMEVL